MKAQAIKFKWLISEYDVRSTENSRYPLMSVSQYLGVIPRSELKGDEGRAETTENYKTSKTGQIVLNRMSAASGALGLATTYGLVSPDYAVLQPSNFVEPKYLYYLMKSDWFTGQMVARLKGIGAGGESASVRTPRVNISDLGDIDVNLPPIEEQRRIADYLDYQLSIIRKIEDSANSLARLIQEDLRAQNEVLFAEADAERVPLRRVAQLITDKRNDSLPTVSLDLVQARRGTLIVSELPITEGLTSTRMKKGDIAFGKLRPYLGKVYLAVDETFAESEFIVMRTDKNLLSQQYLSKYLLTQGVLNELESLSVGSKMPRTSWDQIASLTVPLPNLMVQQEICNRISANEAIANKKARVLLELSEKLDEYRKSLTSSAITGAHEIPSEWRR